MSQEKYNNIKLNIKFHDMQFFAYHGVYDFEKEQGNDYLVNINIEVPITKGVETDKLEDTLNYEAIYNITKQEMSVSSDLIEHVAYRIATAIKDAFTDIIIQLDVEVAKKNPPFEGKVNYVSTKITL